MLALASSTPLSSVNINSTVLNEISYGAFKDCISLESINLPDSLTRLVGSAFYGCESLKSISLPSGVTSLFVDTFHGCTGLKRVDLPSHLTKMYYNVFYNCSSLESIIIPSTVTEIGENVFYGCSSLDSVVYLGTNVSFGQQCPSNAFSGCDQLKFVCVPPAYDSDSFCGLNPLCKNESCESFVQNQCFAPVCNNDTISMTKRKSAIEWENKTNACYEYQCVNDSGPIYWSQCNSTEEIKRECRNDQCIVIEQEASSGIMNKEKISIIIMAIIAFLIATI